jgi:hypothetical protein
VAFANDRSRRRTLGTINTGVRPNHEISAKRSRQDFWRAPDLREWWFGNREKACFSERDDAVVASDGVSPTTTAHQTWDRPGQVVAYRRAERRPIHQSQGCGNVR